MNKIYQSLSGPCTFWIAALLCALVHPTAALCSTQHGLFYQTCGADQSIPATPLSTICALTIAPKVMSPRAPFAIPVVFADGASALWHSSDPAQISTKRILAVHITRPVANPPALQTARRLNSGVILPSSAVIGLLLFSALISGLNIKRQRRNIVFHSQKPAVRERPTLRLMSRQLIRKGVHQRKKVRNLPICLLHNQWRVSRVMFKSCRSGGLQLC